MAMHTINPCLGCGDDLGDIAPSFCRLCEAEQFAAGRTYTAAKRSAFDWMDRDQLLVTAIQMTADCERLRRELDDATGVIR